MLSFLRIASGNRNYINSYTKNLPLFINVLFMESYKTTYSSRQRALQHQILQLYVAFKATYSCVSGETQRVPLVGYTTVGTTCVPPSALRSFAVPLQAPVRQKNRM